MGLFLRINYRSIVYGLPGTELAPPGIVVWK
jgi:hypothetical protein